jgi:hypothetical protein
MAFLRNTREDIPQVRTPYLLSSNVDFEARHQSG